MKAKLTLATLAGFIVASQALGAETPTTTDKTTTMGECHGVNTCKGKGECAGSGHSCAGMNTCKGKGWITMSEKDCKNKKGKWQKSSGMMGSPQTETKK